MKKKHAVAATLLALLLGCITIPSTFEAHITIDIRHIEERADDLLDYLDEQSGEDAGVSWFQQGLDLLSPMGIVYAESKDASPLFKRIKESMGKRARAVNALKSSGAVGENNRGLLELVDDTEFANDEEKNNAQRVVSEENRDRKTWYKEEARLSEDGAVTVSNVERVHARKRLARAKTGQLYQLPAAGEDFDAFKASETGKKLADQCVPGAWVTIP